MAKNPFDDPNYGAEPGSASQPNPFDDDDYGKSPGLIRGTADTLLYAAENAARGLGSVAHSTGPNPVSRGLNRAADAAAGFQSSHRRNERAGRDYKIDEAEQSGSKLKEIGAYVGAFGEAPIDTTIGALAYGFPTLLAARSRSRAAAPAVGAVQGAGIVKGSIYDAVEKAYLEDGASPEEAARHATQAQAYNGKNYGHILLGMGLGGVGAGVGLEPAVRRMMGREAGEQASRGIIRGAARGAATEAPLEMLQGGQERLASNLAERREGFDTPLMQGVIGGAALEGIAGGAAGGGFGGVEGFANRRAQARQDPSGNTAEQGVDPRVPPSPVPEAYRRERVSPVSSESAQESPAQTEILALPAPPAPTRSEQLGINPDNGPMSSAAAMAVDGGASEAVAIQQAKAEASPAQAQSVEAESWASLTPEQRSSAVEKAGIRGVLARSVANSGDWSRINSGLQRRLADAMSSDDNAEPSQPAPPAPSSAPAMSQMQRRAASRRPQIRPERDELMTAIARVGGISLDEARAQGIDPAHFRDRVGSNNPFRKNGRSFDDLAEELSQHGYMPAGYTANNLVDMVSQSLSGNPSYTPTGWERIAEAEAQERAALEALEAGDQALIDSIAPQIEGSGEADGRVRLMAALVNDAIESGVDVSRIDAVAQQDNTYWQAYGKILALVHEARYGNSIRQSGLEAGQSSSVADPEAISDELWFGQGETDEATVLRWLGETEEVLTQPTPDSLRAIDERAEKARAKSAAAENKAKQDEAAKDFVLSGSNSVADQAAARGQFDLLSPSSRAERRSGLSERDALTKDLNQMTPAELDEAIRILRSGAMVSPLTGLGSKRAWYLRVRKEHEASIDADSLKWVNDNLGHAAGDQLLQAIGTALSDAGVEGYHVSGDEFYATSADKADLEKRLAKAQKSLSSAVITGNGWTMTGAGFSYGIGPDIESAERGLIDDKSKREKAGSRASRGERPAGAVRADEGNEQRAEAPADSAPAPDAPESTVEPKTIKAAADEAATSPANSLPEPTQAQKDAGNYRKGHIQINGHDISIENPAGSRRRPEWNPLKNHYGYIRGTVGKDKDHVDVFLTNKAGDASLPVFVVDQNNADGSFDEHKVIMGAATEAEARNAYLSNYQPGWSGLGAITQMTQDDFRAWVRNPALTAKRASADESGGSISEPSAQERGRRGRSPGQKNLDLFAPEGVPKDTSRAQTADNFYRIYRNVPTNTYSVGTLTASSPEAAAHIVAPLRKHGQESMIALVLDKDDKVIHAVYHTKGLKDSASVDSLTLVGAVASTEGAESVWLAHNHPSGVVEPSGADKRITKEIVLLLDRIGVSTKGHVIVGPGGKASLFDAEKNWSGEIKPMAAPRGRRLQLTERVLRKARTDQPMILNSPTVSAEAAKGISSADALLLLGNQYDLVGVISLSPEEMKGLRNKDLSKRIISGIDATNATAAIIKTGDRAAAKNLASYLNTLGSFSVADWLYPSENGAGYKSDAIAGAAIASSRGVYFSRSASRQKRGRMSADAVSAAAKDLSKKWKNSPEIIVVDSMTDERVPEAVRREDASQRSNDASGDPEGFFYRDKIYIIAGSINSEADVQRVVFHEALGHYGLRGVFGGEITKILQQVATMRRQDVEAKAKQYGLDLSDRNQRLMAAEEVLAEMAETRPELHFVQRAIAAIRSWLRENIPGFGGLRLSDAEIIRDYIIPARAFVESGSAGAAPEGQPMFSRGDFGKSDSYSFDESSYRKPVVAWAKERFGDQIAPNGKPSWQNFVRWFGDSKVVDGDEPMVVYHGTAAGFTVFDRGRLGYNTMGNASDPAYGATSMSGFWFNTGEIMEADNSPYADYMQSYVRIENPLSFDSLGDLADELRAVIPVEYEDTGEVRSAVDAWVAEQISEGYDGIRITDEEFGGNSYVAFSPEQIKSAIGNTGEFDGDSPDIRFSRSSDDANAASRMAQNLGDALGSVTVSDLKAIPKKVGEALGNKATDWAGIGLQFLGRRQLVEVYGKNFLPLEAYERLSERMSADENRVAATADDLARRWGEVSDQAALADVMHDATLAGIDADPTAELPLSVLGDERINGLRDRFDKLSDPAKAIYREVRDAYKDHHAQVLRAIRDRIRRSEMSSARKAELMKRLDAEFSRTVPGVYFPLQRFGKYVVVATDGDGAIVSVQRAETMGEAKAVRESLQQQFPADKGFNVGKVILDKAFAPSRDSVGRGFIRELFDAVDELGLASGQKKELEDTIGQLYLSSLPDQSWAKHSIHRKGTPGFSKDARRAFATNMFHGGRHLAKLRYADRMSAELMKIQDYANERRNDPDFDQPKAQRVIDEMVKRHEALNNRDANPLSSAFTSLGFVFFLGLSPAAAAVNISQTALVAYPIMGAKWGFDKAGAALLKASGQAAYHRGKDGKMTFNKIEHALSPEERRAFNLAVRDGTIDITQAHDLAGIAQGEDSRVMWAMRPIMRVAGFMFHQAEVFNRQVTFVAAYRLARDAGTGPREAYIQAKDAVYRGHFDYSVQNRARITQGNIARVVFLFKQYSQNMIFTMANNFMQAVGRDVPKKQRKQAAQTFAGIMAGHLLAAGALGLPLVNTVLSAIDLLAEAFGDDDEPFNAETALRNGTYDVLSSFMGKPAARRVSEAMFRGLSRLTPADISGRVSLSNLLFPDIQEGLDGARAAERFITDMLGPVPAMLITNPTRALQDMANGRWQQGLERMLPLAFGNILKSYRFASEGVKDRTGIQVLDEVSAPGWISQAVGFSPSEVRRAYEGKSAIYQADRRLGERRSELLGSAAKASMENNQADLKKALAEIAEFNRKHPSRAIKPNNITQSIRSRQRRIDEAEQGIYLPQNRRGALDEGRFAGG